MALELIKCEDKPEGKDGPTVQLEFHYDVGDSLQDAIDKYGEEGVFEVWKPAMRLKAQKTAKIINRRGMDYKEFMLTYKPTDKLERGTRVATPEQKEGDFMDMWETWDDEKRAEVMARMGLDMSALNINPASNAANRD